MDDRDAQRLALLRQCLEDNLEQEGFASVDVRCSLRSEGSEVEILIGARRYPLAIEQLRGEGISDLAMQVTKHWMDHREI